MGKAPWSDSSRLQNSRIADSFVVLLRLARIRNPTEREAEISRILSGKQVENNSKNAERLEEPETRRDWEYKEVLSSNVKVYFRDFKHVNRKGIIAPIRTVDLIIAITLPPNRPRLESHF